MCMVLKKWCCCKGRGNRPPTDPLFASTFTSLLPKRLCPLLPLFFMFWSVFSSVLCIWLKSTYSCFWFKVENVAISSWWANQIPFQSLLLLNEVLQTVNGNCSPARYFILFSGRGVSCSKEKWRMRAILEGGVYLWDRVGCQFLSGAEVCVAVSLWQGDGGGGVGARQGLTWSKTQMQNHIGKVREREKSHAGHPSQTPSPLFPLSPFSHNNSHGRDEP